MILVIPHTFESLGTFLREDLPKLVWQTSADSTFKGRIGRQIVGDMVRPWKTKIDTKELLTISVRAGMTYKLKYGLRRFLISSQPSGGGTEIEIIETKSWGWLTASVLLALMFFIIPGIFRIIGNRMRTSHNRTVLESVAAKICLLFPGTQVGGPASVPMTVTPNRAALPPPPVPVMVPQAESSVIARSSLPSTHQAISSRPLPFPPTQVWSPPPVPLQMVKPPILSSSEQTSSLEVNEPPAPVVFAAPLPPPPSKAFPPSAPNYVDTPGVVSTTHDLPDNSSSASRPSLLATHRLKITAALVGIVVVAALSLAWPWISNEVFNAAPQPAKITSYITPLIRARIDQSSAVKVDVSITKITKTGFGKADAQIHVRVSAVQDFLDGADFEDVAKAKGYDGTSFENATKDAEALPQDFAPAAVHLPVLHLARVATPKGTQHDYDFLVTANRVGTTWNFSMSPDAATLTQIENFSGTPSSSWSTQPDLVDSEAGVQAVAAILDYRKSFIAAVDRAKTNYAKFQQEELQRKQNAVATPPTSPTQAQSPTSTQAPTKEYPPKTIIKGKVALCLRAATSGQADALLVQCDGTNDVASNIQGTVVLIGYPPAATSKVGDVVNVPGDFVSVVTLNAGAGNEVDPQYRFSGSISQNPDDQLNALYQQIIASGKVNSEALKSAQLKWITYRDKEAGFEALLAGGTAPDEATRQTSLKRITTKRVADLQHIAQDGISGDLPSTITPMLQNSLSAAFANLFQAVNSKQEPPLIAAYTDTEKAWDSFANLQASLDRHSLAAIAASDGPQHNDTTAVRLASERVDELKTVASSIGVALNVEAQTAADDTANQTEQAPQQQLSSTEGNASIKFLSAGDIGGNSYKGRGHIYSIPDLGDLVGKDTKDAWLYGSFFLFNQDGNQAICHPKTAWSMQFDEVHIDFDQLTLPVESQQEMANLQQAFAIYESGNVDAYINFSNQNKCLGVLFVAKKNHPLKILKVYRRADGKIVALTKSSGGFRIGDGTVPDSTANAAPTPNANAVPSGIVIPENPGFVRSPYAQDQPPVDVRGYASGTQVRCPYTNKIFVIP